MTNNEHFHGIDRGRTDRDRLLGYPRWVQDMAAGTDAAKSLVAEHEAWRLMRTGSISSAQHRNIMVGFWPLIEKFPHFLALNLVKTSYGRDAGVNAARSWLARNLRLEQKHAEWFLDWAEAFGTPREEMLDGWRPVEMTVITDWCWRVCEAGDLAEAMAATNFAIEGVTGEWTPRVSESPAYRALIEDADPGRGMRWLQAHADYDDAHPWEALAIIAQLAGGNPAPARVRGIRDAIVKSYGLYRLALDAALDCAAEEQLRPRETPAQMSAAL
jgi:pyrroloquinoline quinone (PQQ) biosynthesis protein C